MQSCCWEDMILSSAQEKADYEIVNKYWSDFGPMTYGRFDICDMEGEMDYSAAREFTEERLEEIRQVEEEIRLLEGYNKSNKSCSENSFVELRSRERHATSFITVRRTIVRLHAALKELKRGMKI